MAFSKLIGALVIGAGLILTPVAAEASVMHHAVPAHTHKSLVKKVTPKSKLKPKKLIKKNLKKPTSKLSLKKGTSSAKKGLKPGVKLHHPQLHGA